ncbi:hypothetical protein [Sphingomonas glaciei]|uniref:Phage shock protein B n=1 Tax=Sphingomonas glaciei TaxID=2938948 RepID=A0ABY5MVR5_9SPHN|nr:hypothetical protein [Sphingomonas glaciei]UUR08559.1 hypothetical protein M1K48_02655 [Sphingomonas glaciei]
MNPFEFVLIILGMIFIFQIIKHKMGIRTDENGEILPPPQDSGEARLLRDEVRQLKERIQVLERITVEKENSLAREIEDLRRS